MSSASSSVTSVYVPPPSYEPPVPEPKPPVQRVPEPSAWLLMLMGLFGLVAARKKLVK